MRTDEAQHHTHPGLSSVLRSPDALLRLRIIAAFVAIYLIWGSTYLGIRFAIETLPPFFMVGVRFSLAGAVLYAWTRLRGSSPPAPVHWRSALILGALMILAANGGVAWAQQRIASGLAALIVATMPLWIVLLDWIRPGGVRPTRGVALGLILGFIGIALLIGPADLIGSHYVDPIAATVLILVGFAWSVGSLYSREAPVPAVLLQGTAMQMLAGGMLLLLLAGITGEWGRLDVGSISPRSLLALGYLIVFGSFVAFTSYVWLLRVSTPARASTYAYVSPVVAMFLGWALADEPVTLQILLAAAIIAAAVAMVIIGRRRGQGVSVAGPGCGQTTDCA